MKTDESKTDSAKSGTPEPQKAECNVERCVEYTKAVVDGRKKSYVLARITDPNDPELAQLVDKGQTVSYVERKPDGAGGKAVCLHLRVSANIARANLQAGKNTA